MGCKNVLSKIYQLVYISTFQNVSIYQTVRISKSFVSESPTTSIKPLLSVKVERVNSHIIKGSCLSGYRSFAG